MARMEGLGEIKRKFLTAKGMSTHLVLLMLNTADTGPALHKSVAFFKLAIPQTQ